MQKQQHLAEKEDHDNVNNQSCPALIQEDITMSRNSQVIRQTKSQQITAELDEQFERMNTDEKRNAKKQTNKKLGVPEKSVAQQMIEVNRINQRGTDFDCEIVQSVEYSCDEDSFRSTLLKQKSKKGSQNQLQDASSPKKQQKHKNKQKEPDQLKKNHIQIEQDNLNVLIAGAQDTGKTTFIHCFKKKNRKRDEPNIKARTQQIKYETGLVDQNFASKRSNVQFVDLPGFIPSEEDNYLKQIEDYARKQWQNYTEKPQKDMRIHCCLYFLRGPRIKQSDIKVMKILSFMFSLIPVLAKSDQYTPDQIRQIKEDFKRKISAQNRIQFYDLKEFIGLQFQPEQRNRILSSDFGQFPPFVVACSTQRQSLESSAFVRKYPWGIVQIQNQKHNDFRKLCKLLSQVLKPHLITRTLRIVQRADSQEAEQAEGQIRNEPEPLLIENVPVEQSRRLARWFSVSLVLVGISALIYLKKQKEN